MRDKRGQWETIGGQEGAMGAKGVAKDASRRGVKGQWGKRWMIGIAGVIGGNNWGQEPKG